MLLNTDTVKDPYLVFQGTSTLYSVTKNQDTILVLSASYWGASPFPSSTSIKKGCAKDAAYVTVGRMPPQQLQLQPPHFKAPVVDLQD